MEEYMFKVGTIFVLYFIEVLSPTLLHPPEPVEMGVTEQQELGYMPLRDDFEKVISCQFIIYNRQEVMPTNTKF